MIKKTASNQRDSLFLFRFNFYFCTPKPIGWFDLTSFPLPFFLF